jgi:hypothetical protein
MSRFKITGALWDRIHHFAAFPQTGGMLPLRFHRNLANEQSHSSKWSDSVKIHLKEHY